MKSQSRGEDVGSVSQWQFATSFKIAGNLGPRTDFVVRTDFVEYHTVLLSSTGSVLNRENGYNLMGARKRPTHRTNNVPSGGSICKYLSISLCLGINQKQSLISSNSGWIVLVRFKDKGSVFAHRKSILWFSDHLIYNYIYKSLSMKCSIFVFSLLLNKVFVRHWLWMAP